MQYLLYIINLENKNLERKKTAVSSSDVGKSHMGNCRQQLYTSSTQLTAAEERGKERHDSFLSQISLRTLISSGVL
jgi:hypothetical protein